MLGLLLGLLVRLWVATLRVHVVGRARWEPFDRRPWVLAFYHGHQFALLAWRRRRPASVLVSLSRDGDLQARVLPWFRLRPLRGSSSRGGARALLQLVRQVRLRGDEDAAFAVDGPRGPYGVIHSGALVAARALDGVLLPLASASRPVHVFRRAWDRFELPYPFAQVVIVLGEPIKVTKDLTHSTAALHQALVRARNRAEEIVTR